MKKKITIVLSILLSFILLTACGSSYSSASSPAASPAAGYAATETAYEEGYWEEYLEEPAEDAKAENLDLASDKTVTADTPNELSSDKLVYTCNIDIETMEYTQSVDDIREKIKTYKGVIESEQESDDDYQWYYDGHVKTNGTKRLYLTVRIPSESYESFVKDMESIGKVRNKTQNVQNISRQYHSAETRIEALQIEQKRLLEMLEKAEEIEDMIFIEERLTNVEYELNDYKTSLEDMDLDVRYSTVNISLNEVMLYTREAPRTVTFLQRIKNAFSGSIRSFGRFWENVITAFIYILPFLLVGLIIFFIIRAVKLQNDPRTPEERKRDRQLAKEAKAERKKLIKEAKANAKAAKRKKPNGEQ